MGIKLAQLMIQHKVIFSLFLALGLIAINSAMAADSGAEIPLKVNGVWYDKVQLDLPIWVSVENLYRWAQQPGHDASKFVLVLNGIEFKGVEPSAVTTDNCLAFRLTPASGTANAWKKLVSPPLKKNHEWVTVSVQHGNAKVEGYWWATLKIFNWTSLYILPVLVGGLLILFSWLAIKTDVIRIPGESPKLTDIYGKPVRKPYSLARTQMACWTLVVLISYIFIWSLTWDLGSLTPTVIGLMGISVGTALSSAVVDSSKRNDQLSLIRILQNKMATDEVEAKKLQGELVSLNDTSSTISAPTSTERQSEAKKKEIKQSKQKIQELKEIIEPVPSKGFIQDILNDDEGLSFHRFQMFAWTIVLIVIFIWSVLSSLSMPEIDGTLLALMGLSGGTFVGFKLPDQQG